MSSLAPRIEKVRGTPQVSVYTIGGEKHTAPAGARLGHIARACLFEESPSGDWIVRNPVPYLKADACSKAGSATPQIAAFVVPECGACRVSDHPVAQHKLVTYS